MVLVGEEAALVVVLSELHGDQGDSVELLSRVLLEDGLEDFLFRRIVKDDAEEAG